jgi:hypothetical protein
MSYDENKISDQIDGGNQLHQEVQEIAHEMYENMFYCIPSKGLTLREHDKAAKKCAEIAAMLGKHYTKNENYWNLIISEIKNI